jgi:Domain of unknown function (DUF892)
MFQPDVVTTPLSVGPDGLVGELRGLYGAERQLLQTLGSMAQVVHLTRVKQAIASFVNGTGTRLWRLEAIFELLREDVASRPSPGLRHIIESRWRQQNHRLQHALLELHIVGSTLQEAAAHLAVLYAVAERRARGLELGQVAAQLSESRRDAEAMALLVTRHTGVQPGPLAPLRTADLTFE